MFWHAAKGKAVLKRDEIGDFYLSKKVQNAGVFMRKE
jgi:hypothetical protein